MEVVGHIHDYFFERHIALNSEWLNDAVAFLQTRKRNLTVEALTVAVYEQWLFSDLKESSTPNLEHLLQEREKKFIDFHDGMVLQIESIVDISRSLYSQWKVLTYEFEDNTGFSAKADEQEDQGIRKSEKRMLLMVLSDGTTSLRGIEYESIPAVSLLTCPGCKVLLQGQVTFRDNTLLLTRNNFFPIGGDSENLINGCPVEVISSILKSTTSSVVNERKPEASQNKRRHSSLLTVQNTNANSITELKNSGDIIAVKGHLSSANASVSQQPVLGFDIKQEYGKGGVMVLDNKRPIQFLSEPTRNSADPSAASLSSNNNSDMHFTAASRNFKTNSELRKRPNIKEDPDSPFSDTAANTVVNNKTFVKAENFAAGKSLPSNFGWNSAQTANDFLKKNIKVEVDDEICIIGESMSTPPKITPDNKGSSRLLGRSKEECQTISFLERDQLVSKFLQSDIVSISDAIKASRFCIGSRKRKILAVVFSVAEPLRIVDDLWTMTVCLTDESYGCLKCIIAHSVLLELIGLTPEEAKAVRASNDKARRREGTARLKSVKETIERLDIVWEIEFYAAGKTTPVVRGMETLSQLLKLVD